MNTTIEPAWIQSSIPADIHESDRWRNFLDFFLICSPCNYQSFRRKTIESIWGKAPWTSKRYLKRHLNFAISGDDSCIISKANSKADFDRLLIETQLTDDFFKNPDRQSIALVKAPNPGNNSVYMSFFYHLRNSLAHGRFGLIENSKKEAVFLFEDGRPTDNRTLFELTARGIILIESLFNIIEVIEAGPQAEPDLESKIINAINAGYNTKKKIIELLDLSPENWRTYSQVLKKEQKITYAKQRWSVNRL